MVTIGQLSLETGVSPRAIRLYESGGLLGVVARRENGYRVYSQQNIKLLCLIKALRELDYSLGEIQRILRDPMGNLGSLVDKQLLDVHREILRLRKLEEGLLHWSRRLQDSEALDLEELQILLELQKQMLESHLSPKALEETKAKHEALGESRHQEAQKDLQGHIERCLELCSRGVKPNADRPKSPAPKSVSSWKNS